MYENNENNIQNKQDESIEYAKKKLRKKLPILILIVVLLFIGVVFSLFPNIGNSFACSINHIWSAVTGSEKNIIPEHSVDVKPVIYLYSEEEIDVEVKLNSVDFTTTYPVYDNGWTVKVQSDGGLVDTKGREYNYLYWEGYTGYAVDLSKGFVVSKGEYIDFLEEKLDYIGLSDKEACDFISYWLPLMNEYEYCLVSFQKDYGEKVKIDYNIEPDNELVVFTVIKGLDDLIEIEEQDLSSYKEFSRNGFVVVEWGGRFIK